MRGFEAVRSDMLPGVLGVLLLKLRVNPEMTETSVAEPPDTGEDAEEGPGENRLREPLSLLILFLVCLCAVALLKPDGDPDLFARLAVGKLVVETGQVTVHDPFSYTPKKPEWIDHEWGAGVVFYAVASVAGQKGLLILKALLMFGTLVFMYLRARRATGQPPSLMYHLLLVGALHLGFLATIRAQTLTFFLFSAWLYLLERARDGDWRHAWFIPVSGLIWANLHGGFLAGLGLIILFTVGQWLQRGNVGRFVALALGTGLTSLINPYGPKYWSYLLDATTMTRANIGEWAPVNLLGLEPVFFGFQFLVVLTGAALLSKASKKELPDYGTLLTLIVTAALGLRVMRHTTFFIIASAPFVWTWMSSLVQRWAAQPGRSEAIQARLTPLVQASYYGLSRGLLLVWAVLMLSSTPFRIVLFPMFPVRAVDFIAQNNLKGNLLIPFNFGAYAIWRLYPDCLVAMDGRYETVYEDSTYQAVQNFFAGGKGAREFLEQFPHDIILLSPRNDGMETNLSQRTDWTVAYEDPRARVYVRASRMQEWRSLAPPDSADLFYPKNKPSYAGGESRP